MIKYPSGRHDRPAIAVSASGEIDAAFAIFVVEPAGGLPADAAAFIKLELRRWEIAL